MKPLGAKNLEAAVERLRERIDPRTVGIGTDIALVLEALAHQTEERDYDHTDCFGNDIGMCERHNVRRVAWPDGVEKVAGCPACLWSQIEAYHSSTRELESEVIAATARAERYEEALRRVRWEPLTAEGRRKVLDAALAAEHDTKEDAT